MKKIFSIVMAVMIALGSPALVFAHSGRTDGSGGHKDNRNASGLGSYHYHCGGYSAHLHPDGVCPYAGGTTSSSEQSASGNSHRGWQHNGASWCYSDSQGKNVTGWQKISDQYYCFDTRGTMRTGWVSSQGDWYYCHPDSGKMVCGWKEIDEDWYYFNASGKMLTGWKQINDEWYYFDSEGEMETGWEEIQGVWYYFADNGKMVRDGTFLIDSVNYTFDASGALNGTKYPEKDDD